MPARMTWEQIAENPACQGRWVALEDSAYADEKLEGVVVDADEQLSELCTRIRERRDSHCAIVYCPAIAA